MVRLLRRRLLPAPMVSLVRRKSERKRALTLTSISTEAMKQFPQPVLHGLLIRFPRALKLCRDLAPLHLVRRAGHLDRNCETSCRTWRIHRKLAPPELGYG
jgi:hypothetical protein